MSEITQHLKIVPNNTGNSTKPLTIEHIELLLEKIRAIPEKSEAGGRSIVLPNNVEDIAAQLEALKMKSAPDDLADEVRQAWNRLKDEWASEFTLNCFAADLQKLFEPVRKTANELKQLEQEIEIRRSRLETLRSLVMLLDELTRTEKDKKDFSSGNSSCEV